MIIQKLTELLVSGSHAEFNKFDFSRLESELVSAGSDTAKKFAKQCSVSDIKDGNILCAYEDALVELMGDDEYFEWADRNEIK